MSTLISIKRITKLNWKNLLSIEILLVLINFLLFIFILPIISRQNNTIRIIEDLGINDITLLHGQLLDDSLSPCIYLSNGNMIVEGSDGNLKCNILLYKGEKKQAYADKYLIDKIKEQKINIIYDEIKDEINVKPLIPIWIPFFQNYYPIILIEGYDDFINRYNLPFFVYEFNDISKYTILETANLNDIKYELQKILTIWFSLFFVFYYLVRRFFPVYGGINIIRLYRYLFQFGASNKIIWYDSLLFTILVNSVWLIVFVLSINYFTISSILPCVIFQVILIPIIVEILLFFEGFNNEKYSRSFRFVFKTK